MIRRQKKWSTLLALFATILFVVPQVCACEIEETATSITTKQQNMKEHDSACHEAAPEPGKESPPDEECCGDCYDHCGILAKVENKADSSRFAVKIHYDSPVIQPGRSFSLPLADYFVQPRGHAPPQTFAFVATYLVHQTFLI